MTSYKILDLFIRRWKMKNIEKKIKKHKKIFIESANGKEFDSLLSGFYKCIDQSDENNICNGALLIAVYRGRASEGLDFRGSIIRLLN